MSKDDVTTQAAASGEQGSAAGEQSPVAGAAAVVPVAGGDSVQPDAGAVMQARIAGILGCEEAVGRKATAEHLAFKSCMSVEQAKGVLATVDVAEAEAPSMGNALNAAMHSEGQPEVGADTELTADGKGSQGNALVASYERVTGDK